MKQEELTNQFVKESYNSFLSGYDKSYAYYRWFREPISRYHYKQSKRSFLYCLSNFQYEKSLEIGGGDGEWTKILLGNVKNLDFYDISEEMMGRAKKRLKSFSNINFFLGDFLKNNLENNKYNFVLSFRSFEYFEDKNLFLQEVHRLLRDGGEAILVTKSPAYDWKKYYKTKILHSGILSIREIKKLLKNNSFKIKLVKPAIVGKNLNSSFFRFLFDVFHRINYICKYNLLPVGLLQYISESFIIKVVKK